MSNTNNELYKRIQDWQTQGRVNYRLITSFFLDEGQIVYAKAQLKGQSYTLSGGHPFAKRQVIGFNGEASERIVCLCATYKNTFCKISHRDVYGALMALKLTPEMLGDIFVFEDKIVIYALKQIQMDIIQNLSKIHQLNLSFKVSDILYYKEDQFLLFEKVVSSVRLDAIVSAMANTSRENAKEMIRLKMVKINHVIVENATKSVQTKDIISIQKTGRFVFDGVVKETKKDRLLIAYKKYQ
ncbi:MAG: YlmH/Sll1252 family protein [Erysipelotrichaceae bacterium]